MGNSIENSGGVRIFRKTGQRSRAFRCEANGLCELAKSGAIRVTGVIDVGEDYIETEYIESQTPQGNFFMDFGRQLARMHRHTADTFGFYEDNFIGENPQPNVPSGSEAHDWAEFYWNKRLLFQYRLAEQNGRSSPAWAKAFARLETQLGTILAGSEEPPALLHGDLWAGNFLCDTQNRPVLIDPAVYYGHREAELAMTRMFGGFAPVFYTAYQAEHPLPKGWERRQNLYLLYHVMNHLNLFGGRYVRQAEHLVESYI